MIVIMKLNDSFQIALKSIEKTKIFFVTNVISITVAIFLITIMLSIVYGIKTYVEKQISEGSAILAIEVQNNDESNESRLLNLEKINNFKKIKGVANAFPQYLGFFGYLTLNELNKTMVSLSSIYDYYDLEKKNFQITTGEAKSIVSKKNSILLPENIVRNLGITDYNQINNKQIYLILNRRKGNYEESIRLELTVIGVVEQTRFDRCYLSFDMLHLIKEWQNWNLNNISDSYFHNIYKNNSFPVVIVYASHVKYIESIQNEIQKIGYKTSSIYNLILKYREINKVIVLIMVFLSGISLFTGAIGIFNTSLASVIRRKKEIGIYKAIGASKSDILSIFIWDAVITAFVCSIMTFCISFGFISIINLFLSNFNNLPLLENKWWFYITTDLIAFITCLIATAYPASKASKLNPIDCLKYE